jgi:hypothetical protein
MPERHVENSARSGYLDVRAYNRLASSIAARIDFPTIG